MSEKIYGLLRDYQDGKIENTNVAVGQLTPELTVIYDCIVADRPPLCAAHKSLDNQDNLELHIGNGCVACSLNERNELLEMLTPFSDGDSVQSLFRLIEKHTALLAVAEAADEVTTKAQRLLETFDDKTKRECSRPMFDAAIGLATALEAFEALREG